PSNIGYEHLSFVTDAFRKLTDVSPLDLRVGLAFSGDTRAPLHRALKDAATTIEKNPATFMKYPNGGRILPVNRIGRFAGPSRILLDQTYLSNFGEMLIPRHLWRALQRFSVWIEPALVAEWTRLIKNYASGQGKQLDEDTIAKAMAWE